MRKMIYILLAMVGIPIATASYAHVPIIGWVPKNRVDIRDRVYSASGEDIWDVEELVITNVTIENNSSINAYSPRIRITGASRVERGSTFRAGVPVFKVHFVNMVDPNRIDPITGNPITQSPPNVVPGIGIDFSDNGMTQAEFNAFCQNEIEILNYYFKSDDGRQLVKFSMKNALLWDGNMANTNYYKCISTGSDQKCDPSVYGGLAIHAFNDPDFSPFRDDDAINVVFFDNPYKEVSGGNPNLDVHGTGNHGPPIVIIDYQRVDGNLGHDHNSDGIIDINDDCGEDWLGNVLPGSSNNGLQDDDHTRRGVEPHEMGHVFGLQHVCRDHYYDPSDTTFELWDSVMWGRPLAETPPGYVQCCEDIHDPNCQEWYRTSFFSKDTISRVDDGNKYIQSYWDYIEYEGDFWEYGQAEIIMNMAFHFGSYLE